MDPVSVQPRPQTPMSSQALQGDERGNSSGDQNVEGITGGISQFKLFPSPEPDNSQPAQSTRQGQNGQQEATLVKGGEAPSQGSDLVNRPTGGGAPVLKYARHPSIRLKPIYQSSSLRNEITFDSDEDAGAQQQQDEIQAASPAQGQPQAPVQGEQQAQGQDKPQPTRSGSDRSHESQGIRGGATGNCCQEPFGCCGHWIPKICGCEE
ncbi:hypothetical protein F5Y06DRAFT_306154 [Hypoxylon sp. FL0890]|nr:hypothetical protein F5Y06DRAFT_306154 [Hypoxylon sp. FL0890]